MKVVIKTNEIVDDPFLNMVIMHESLHTLGLGHTTRRKDRLASSFLWAMVHVFTRSLNSSVMTIIT